MVISNACCVLPYAIPLALERELRKVTGEFIANATGRRPMIVPGVMET